MLFEGRRGAACGQWGNAFDSGPASWQGSRRSKNPSNFEVAELANPALGAKQVCPHCSTKFYDLGRRPAVCFKCGTEFDPEEAQRNRRVRTRVTIIDDDAEEVKKPVIADADLDDGFEAETEETAELDQVSDDAPIIGDEDADEAEGGAGGQGESLGVDFSEEDEIDAADDDGVPFIEDDEDEFSDDEIDGLPTEGSQEDR
jgi:uncharacterized protein (TIGR02300 family)